LGPASIICSACNACCHCRICSTADRPEGIHLMRCAGLLLVTLLRTYSYSADPLLFLPDANLIPLSISKLVTVPVSWLVINAECCTLTINLMHCGVRFLLCEVFNYAFPLLAVHVLVFELYPATPQHCPDQFCLLRLRCILTSKLASASMLFQEILVRMSILRSLVPPFLLRRSKC